MAVPASADDVPNPGTDVAITVLFTEAAPVQRTPTHIAEPLRHR